MYLRGGGNRAFRSPIPMHRTPSILSVENWQNTQIANQEHHGDQNGTNIEQGRSKALRMRDMPRATGTTCGCSLWPFILCRLRMGIGNTVPEGGPPDCIDTPTPNTWWYRHQLYQSEMCRKHKKEKMYDDLKRCQHSIVVFKWSKCGETRKESPYSNIWWPTQKKPCEIITQYAPVKIIGGIATHVRTQTPTRTQQQVWHNRGPSAYNYSGIPNSIDKTKYIIGKLRKFPIHR